MKPTPTQELDFIFKMATLSALSLAGEGMLRDAAGEDLTKSASSQSATVRQAMRKAAAFAKKAMPEWIQEMNPAYSSAKGIATTGGAAAGGLGGYAVGSGLGKTIGRAFLDEGETEDEKRKYENRLRLAGLAAGVPGAIAGGTAGATFGRGMGANARVNEFIQGIDAESIGNFLKKITPKVTWDKT
jgi:uncharacterized protein YcfJ